MIRIVLIPQSHIARCRRELSSYLALTTCACKSNAKVKSRVAHTRHLLGLVIADQRKAAAVLVSLGFYQKKNHNDLLIASL